MSEPEEFKFEDFVVLANIRWHNPSFKISAGRLIEDWAYLQENTKGFLRSEANQLLKATVLNDEDWEEVSQNKPPKYNQNAERTLEGVTSAMKGKTERLKRLHSLKPPSDLDTFPPGEEIFHNEYARNGASKQAKISSTSTDAQVELAPDPFKHTKPGKLLCAVFAMRYNRRFFDKYECFDSKFRVINLDKENMSLTGSIEDVMEFIAFCAEHCHFTLKSVQSVN